MKQADQIRQNVLKNIIEPARYQGLPTVHILASSVHERMGLQNRMPAVCSALDADKFLAFANVTLIARNGPHQGSKAEWVFGLESNQRVNG